MAKTKALGRGLDDLMFNIDDNEGDIKEINIDDIVRNENQPRKNFDKEKLNELAISIKEKGLIQPIIVSELKNGKYIIIVGERRWRAAKKAGLKTIPCIIKEYSEIEKIEVALIENIQRENLNPIEEAMTYETLIKHFKLTQEELAKKIGKSRTTISNIIRLLKLPKDIQEELVKENISEGHGRTLLGLDDNKQMNELLERIKKEQLSVREVEKIVSHIKKEGGNINDNIKEKTNEKIETNEIIVNNSDNTNKLKVDSSNKVKENNKSVSNPEIILRGGNLVEEALSEYETIVNGEENNNVSESKKYDSSISSNSSIEYEQNDNEKDENIVRIKAELMKIFGTKIEINKKSEKSGKIEIYYKNNEELNRILEYLGYGFGD